MLIGPDMGSAIIGLGNEADQHNVLEREVTKVGVLAACAVLAKCRLFLLLHTGSSRI